MITVVDGIFIVLLCGYAFYLGREFARVRDNNYSELFQAYIKNNAELEREKYYWMDLYNQLYCSIPDELIEDKEIDMRGRTTGIFIKKEVKECVRKDSN